MDNNLICQQNCPYKNKTKKKIFGFDKIMIYFEDIYKKKIQ